ncbi:MAG: flagellar hook-length control protein FliK, partial [Comamonadaceae bacterium]
SPAIAPADTQVPAARPGQQAAPPQRAGVRGVIQNAAAPRPVRQPAIDAAPRSPTLPELAQLAPQALAPELAPTATATAQRGQVVAPDSAPADMQAPAARPGPPAALQPVRQSDTAELAPQSLPVASAPFAQQVAPLSAPSVVQMPTAAGNAPKPLQQRVALPGASEPDAAARSPSLPELAARAPEAPAFAPAQFTEPAMAMVAPSVQQMLTPAPGKPGSGLAPRLAVPSPATAASPSWSTPVAEPPAARPSTPASTLQSSSYAAPVESVQVPAIGTLTTQAMPFEAGDSALAGNAPEAARPVTDTFSSAADSLFNPAAATAANPSGIVTSQASSTTVQHATLSPAVGSQDWDKALGQQVLHLSKASHQVAELQLNPPGLGPLKITVNLNEHQMQLMFVSAHASVRAAVEAAVPQLRATLADSGIQLGSTSVSAESQPQTAFTQSHGQSHSSAAQHRAYQRSNAPDQLDPAARRTAGVRQEGAGVDIYA